jgi:hypothetical protein
MSLTLPSTSDLYAFWGDEADPVDTDSATLAIQQAGGLLMLATTLNADPADSNLAFLVKWAICDMAIYLLIARDNRDAEYSPFQSERVGSYSYSKSSARLYARISKTILINEPTGVLLFDRVVAELCDILAYGDGTIVGGKLVFREDYVPLAYEANALAPFFRFLDPEDHTGQQSPFLTWPNSADNDSGQWY